MFSPPTVPLSSPSTCVSPVSLTPALNGLDAKTLHDFLHQVVTGFAGNANDLESAMGMYMLARYLGWRAIYLIHSKKTVKKYEAILGIKIQQAFDELGPDANRSAGWQAAALRPSFWKVVSGEDPINREERKKIHKGT